MWSERAMARRLDWEKRRFDRHPKLCIKDEVEFRSHDVAARWLEKAEAREARRKKSTTDARSKNRTSQRRP
jgi:hypothetical protein